MLRKPNVPLGLLYGTLFAVVYSVVAAVIFVVRGPRAFDQYGITIGQTIGLYWVGGLLGGGVVGFLLPLTKWRAGAMMVGVIAAMPVFGGAAMMLGSNTLGDAIIDGSIAAIIVGGPAGYLMWRPYRIEDDQGVS